MVSEVATMTDNGDQFDEMCAKRKSDRDKPVDAQWLEGQGWRYRPSVVSFGCVYIYDLSGERYLSVGISKGRVHSHLSAAGCTGRHDCQH
jgi:hypothetical protein